MREISCFDSYGILQANHSKDTQAHEEPSTKVHDKRFGKEYEEYSFIPCETYMYPRIDPALLQFLETHAILFEYYEHIPLFTVEEAEQIKHQIPGKHTKNLFLSDKK